MFVQGLLFGSQLLYGDVTLQKLQLQVEPLVLQIRKHVL